MNVERAATAHQPGLARKLPPLCPPFRFATVEVSSHVQILVHDASINHATQEDLGSAGTIADAQRDTSARASIRIVPGAVKLGRRRKSQGDELHLGFRDRDM
jgi:hypothetical protein